MVWSYLLIGLLFHLFDPPLLGCYRFASGDHTLLLYKECPMSLCWAWCRCQMNTCVLIYWGTSTQTESALKCQNHGNPESLETICSTCNNKDDPRYFSASIRKVFPGFGTCSRLRIFLQEADSVQCKKFPISPVPRSCALQEAERIPWDDGCRHTL